MKQNKYILLLSVALMAASCQDHKDLDPSPAPTAGDDVCFGGNLDENSVSRTIYGEETTDESGHYFPINWVKGDQVFIASPDCRPDYNQGTFQVPDNADNRNYAGTFNKVSGAVQWGSEGVHTFYSIYPQRKGNFAITTTAPGVFNMNMDDLQPCIISKDKDKDGNPQMKTAYMDACFMYAKKIFDPATEEDKNIVKLQYTPLSTALRFKLQGPGTRGQISTISLVRIIAPNSVALTGKFSVDLSGDKPVVNLEGNNSNIVTVQALNEDQGLGESYLQLHYGESVELNAFIIPQENITIGDGWKIEVVLSSGYVLTKSITTASTSTTSTNVAQTLKAGQIHRLGSLPKLPLEEIDLTKWLEFVPRNVYLSEISLPGSWNSLNKDFQTQANSQEAGSSETEDISKKTIDQQYALGCRAFHLDTRFRRINATSTDFTNLGIANGGDTAEPVGGGGKKVMTQRACPLFSEALGYITANVKPNEYMVVICTFAQNSYEGADWRQKVSDACASNDAVYDASKINANTTVGDVLGKVIVIVNCEGAVPSISGSKCLFVNAPLTMSASTFASGYPSQALYKGSGESGLSLNYIQAQVTSNDIGFDTGTGSPLSPIAITGWSGDNRGYAPNLTQRQTIGGNILTWSSQNVTSQNYQHKDWIFLGLGGYLITPTKVLGRYKNYDEVDNGREAVAASLNPWINKKVTDMDDAKAHYPVGIVLMNKVKESGTGWSSPTTIENIVFLNNKFNKAYDDSKPAWPDQVVNVQSAAPGYSSGMKDNNQNAISGN